MPAELLSMLLIYLLLLHGVSSAPLPEFNLQSGGRGVQREIPTFDGVDWTRSKRGVCYDKGSEKNVAMGHQFYLDCGRCTCDRYGFWCIPKCSPYYNPDLENCVEIVDSPDPCCPRRECLRYKDPSKGPTTNPWGKGTMTQDGLDNLMVRTASAETESVTITATVTLDEGEGTTNPATSPESTTQFGGAFTTGSTQKVVPRAPTESATKSDLPSTEPQRGSASLSTEAGTGSSSPSTDTLTEILTPTIAVVTENSVSSSTSSASTQRLTTPKIKKTSSESSRAPVISTPELQSSSSEGRSLGYITGTSDSTSDSTVSDEPRQLRDDSLSRAVTNSLFTVTEGSDLPSPESDPPSPESESYSEGSYSTGSPGPQSTSPSQKPTEQAPTSTRAAVKTSDYPTSSSNRNPSESTSGSGVNPPDSSTGASQSTQSSQPTGTTESAAPITKDSFSEISLKTEVFSTETVTMSTSEDSGINSTPDYY
ncbi:uncharacterized protein LOC134819780 [Bolinopsis microptera]|uniref:uncharacterized protein LOC134819780 n=1 Tax=Bolinopsis microptera TaxID=2820187 RepID=UPI003078BD8D